MSLLYNTNGYLQNSDIPCLEGKWGTGKTLTSVASRQMSICKTLNHPLPHGKWVVAKFRHPFPKGKCVLENSDIPCRKANGYFQN